MEENDPIYEKLNLAPISKKPIELIPIDKTDGETLNDDLDEVRTNIHDLIETGDAALDELKELSKQSQDPKAYREFTVLLKVMLDANKSLIDNARARKEIIGNESNKKINTTNNLFIGSTSDAVKILKEKSNEEI